MPKTKILLSFTFFSLFIITLCKGQNKSLEKEIKEIDSLVYAQRAYIVIPKIDSLLVKELPISKDLHLKTLKIISLVHIEKLETALIFCNKLLKNKDLKGASLIRTHLQRGLIFGLLNRLKEMRLELDFVRDYYENPNITKDELYGEYLIRVTSWHQVQNSIKEAIVYAERAIDFGQRKNYSNVEATGLVLTAITKYKPSDKEYVEYREKAIRIWEKSGNFHGMSWTYAQLFYIYNNKKQSKKAFAYLDSSLIFAKKVKYFRGMARNYLILSKFNEDKNDKEKALNYYKLFKKASDSSSLQTENRKVEEIQSKYNFEKETVKNKALEQNLINEKKEKNSLFIGLIILLTLLCILVYLTIRITKKRKEIKTQAQIIEDKNLELTDALDENKLLLKELNHRINNNLALILSLVKFQYYEVDEPKYKEKFQSLEHRIKTIAAAHEQLLYNRENLDGENYDVQEYLSKIANALIEISTRNITLNLKATGINFNMDTMLPVGILINELISNSLKHAISKPVLNIDIQITLQQSNIQLTYKDSGTTFIETTTKKSLGVSIINSMVKQLKGSIERKNSEYKISLQLKNSKEEK